MAGVDGPCSLLEAPLVCCSYCQDPALGKDEAKGPFPAIPRLGGLVGPREMLLVDLRAEPRPLSLLSRTRHGHMFPVATHISITFPMVL